MPLVSVGDPPHPSLRFGHARSVIIESPVPATRAFLFLLGPQLAASFALAERAMSGIGTKRTWVCALHMSAY